MPYTFKSNRRHSHLFGVGWLSLGGNTASSETFLDAIPGGLAWLCLILVTFAAIKAPLAMIFGAALLGVYSSVRFLFAGVATFIGLRKIRHWESLDWKAEYQRRATESSLPFEKVHHLIIIPNYKEEIDTLRRTLDRLAQQRVARQQVSVMLAMESGEEEAIEKGRQLEKEYAPRFAHFFFDVHPRGLHQEMQCKSANEAWAARRAKTHLIGELGYDVNHIVVTTMDADTLWHPEYLTALTTLFATDEKRYAAFWQAPIRYHSNVWQIHPFMRLLHAYSTCWELAYLAAPWWIGLPMSSYSLSLRLLDSAGYWDPDVIADEWHMYIKAFFQRDGDLVLRPVFLPFHASATEGKNFWDELKQRYNQTFRHAWGAKEIGYAIAQAQEHPQVSRLTSFNLVFRVAHDNLLAGAGWIILSAGIQLPSILHPDVVQANLMSPPFLLVQASLAMVSVLSIIFWIVDIKTRPPRPDSSPPTRKEQFFSLISIPALPTVTLICVALPVLHSQTRLMLGYSLAFRVTRKQVASDIDGLPQG